MGAPGPCLQQSEKEGGPAGNALSKACVVHRYAAMPAIGGSVDAQP
jgi:hypothetical protein